MQRIPGSILTLLTSASLVWAQSESASLTGMITDPFGAVQGNAQVTAVQEQTGARIQALLTEKVNIVSPHCGQVLTRSL